MLFGFFAIDWLLPPTLLAILALVALLVSRRHGRALAIGLLIALLALGTPLLSDYLLGALDIPAVPIPPEGPPPGAIVILSADVERSIPDGRDGTDAVGDIGPLTLERERAGAALARRTNLPILVTGGLVNVLPPVAHLMARSLVADFRVPVRWVEDRSLTTWENAAFSVPMLRASGISRIYLVTHAWHMRRSLLAFRRAGMDAVPAPVRLYAGPRWTVSELMPRASAWQRSFFALHEWLGLLYYTVRG